MVSALYPQLAITYAASMIRVRPGSHTQATPQRLQSEFRANTRRCKKGALSWGIDMVGCSAKLTRLFVRGNLLSQEIWISSSGDMAYLQSEGSVYGSPPHFV